MWFTKIPVRLKLKYQMKPIENDIPKTKLCNALLNYHQSPYVEFIQTEATERGKQITLCEIVFGICMQQEHINEQIDFILSHNINNWYKIGIKFPFSTDNYIENFMNHSFIHIIVN